jgi:pyrimidine operon attenuation protein/uracil phosphoribosyltransferase
MPTSPKYILDQQTAEKKLRRMALQIVEQNSAEKRLILAGIADNGSVVAEVIKRMIAEFSGIEVQVIKITLDKRQPAEVKLNSEDSFDGEVIIITDDVSNSGRTLAFALKPFLLFRPKKIQALVLVERSHNSFPVHPDYTGLSIATTLQEHIYVEVENGNIKGAYLQ